MADMLSRLPEIFMEAQDEYNSANFPGNFKTRKFAPSSNVIALGDNADFLYELRRQKQLFDFVYIDPPFYSDANYQGNIKLGDKNVKFTAYRDKWKSRDDFLKMLLLRLFFIRDLLNDSGLVAVHLDTHSVHYVKVLMDALMGEENFVNEIVWSYKSGGAGKRGFARKHDTILLYSKTRKFYFCPQKEISYNRNGSPYRFKGVKEYEDEYGKWYTLVNQKDVISIDMVGRTASERTGYATQKPEKLMEMLLKSCCPESGRTLDVFAGSGSLGAAAAKLGMHYYLCDISPIAYAISCKRLSAYKSKYKTVVSKGFNINESIKESGLSDAQIKELLNKE